MNTDPRVLTLKYSVIQSALCHPEWTVEDHIIYLDSEWWQSDDWRNELPEATGPHSAILAWMMASRPNGAKCDGSWDGVRIPEPFRSDPEVTDVMKCSGCGELMVIHNGTGTDFPPGTPIAEAIKSVLGS